MKVITIDAEEIKTQREKIVDNDTAIEFVEWFSERLTNAGIEMGDTWGWQVCSCNNIVIGQEGNE